MLKRQLNKFMDKIALERYEHSLHLFSLEDERSGPKITIPLPPLMLPDPLGNACSLFVVPRPSIYVSRTFLNSSIENVWKHYINMTTCPFSQKCCLIFFAITVYTMKANTEARKRNKVGEQILKGWSDTKQE